MDNFKVKIPKNYKKDIEIAIKILKESGCNEVFLFGSVVHGKINKQSDIDIAVIGRKEKNRW